MKRADLRAGGRHPLTYCTNLHPAPGIGEAERVFAELAAPNLRSALGEGRLCLGAWWPADLAFALARDEEGLARHGAVLEGLGLVPSSLNLFPMGRFHGSGVKEAVYEPDWASEERLSYTLAAARAQASLCARLGHPRGVMSSLPLGFRGRARSRRPGEAHARNLFRLALALERIEEETGVHLVLALEPEPWCLLESVEEALCWLVDEAFPLGAARGNEAALRRHLGLCLDLCHAAVVGEDPVEATRGVLEAGLRLGKVQLSSALCARGPSGLEALLSWDEPVYLHQTFSGEGGPWLDLSEPGIRELRPSEGQDFRSHFHVPLHWRGEGALSSTRAQVEAFLGFAASGGLPAGVILEIETYTKPRMAEELHFAAGLLLEEAGSGGRGNLPEAPML